MRVPGKKRLTMVGRWLRSRIGKGGLILGYHRIFEESQDFFSLSVSPDNFAEQLAVLRQYANPITLDALVRGLHSGTLPPRAMVVTFDDGYADNLYWAKPLLEQYEVPATLFVATGYLGRRFWWDELASMILIDQELPEQLAITLSGTTFVWPDVNDSGEKRPDLLRKIYQSLHGLAGKERQQAMAQLSKQITGYDEHVDAVNRALTREELIELASDGLVAIGAHTVNHATLTSLSRESQRHEIEQCRRDLEALLGRPISAFSYPNGASDEETRHLVRLADYACACNSYNDITRTGTDPFNLPRFWVPDQNAEHFSRWLRHWLPG